MLELLNIPVCCACKYPHMLLQRSIGLCAWRGHPFHGTQGAPSLNNNDSVYKYRWLNHLSVQVVWYGTVVLMLAVTELPSTPIRRMWCTPWPLSDCWKPLQIMSDSVAGDEPDQCVCSTFAAKGGCLCSLPLCKQNRICSILLGTVFFVFWPKMTATPLFTLYESLWLCLDHPLSVPPHLALCRVTYWIRKCKWLISSYSKSLNGCSLTTGHRWRLCSIICYA